MKHAHQLYSELLELPVAEIWSNGRGKYWLVIQSIRTGEWLHYNMIAKETALRLKANRLRYNVDRGMTVDNPHDD